MAELLRSTSKPALVKNPSARKPLPGRHVAFEEPSKQHHCSGLGDIDSDIDHLDKGRYRPCCFAFCVWSCLALFALITILIFIGISYLVFLQSGMPHVNVRTLSINKLQVDNNSQKMNAIISLGIRISNKNEGLNLLYGPLSVSVTTEDVNLGETKVEGFSQGPHNDTDLDLSMGVKNANVNTYAVEDVRSDMNANEMVFDVYVSGKIGVKYRGLQMINVPFLSSCRQIKQMDVDFGGKPKCEVKMFGFRPSSN